MSNEIVGKALQQALVDLLELSLQTKQAHWNIQGEGFQSLHEHLDEITDMVRDAYDEFAERLVALGMPADGRTQTVANTTVLTPLDEGPIEVGKAYALIEQAMMTVSDSLKGFIEDVDEVDHLSADLFISTARDIEKSAWMLRMENA